MPRYKVQVTDWQPLDVEESELLSLTVAAKRLGISINTMTGLIQRGILRRIVDTTEPNPTRANRVLRAEVEAEIQRRKDSDDTRLKNKRKKARK